MNHSPITKTCTQVPGVTQGNLGLQAAMTEYLDYLQTVARRSPLTIQGYRADYKRFLHFLGEIRPPCPWQTSQRPLWSAGWPP